MRYNKNLRLFDEETEEGGLVAALEQLRSNAADEQEEGQRETNTDPAAFDQSLRHGSAVTPPFTQGRLGASGSQTAANRAGTAGGFSYASAPQYVNQWQGLIDEATKSILNREGFSYDHTQDPLYQQLEQSYTQKGKQAMEDTLGIVSQRTGGLASSYATQAGQQAYQGYMGELADRIPELRQLAYEMYTDEGDRMMDRLSLLEGMEEQDYSRYLNALDQHNADRNFAYGKYADEQARADALEKLAYDRAWDENERAYSRAWDENERAYARGQDALARQDALSELAYERAQDNEDAYEPTLTWPQVKAEIEAGNTSPAVLKAYEYYMGESYIDYGPGYGRDGTLDLEESTGVYNTISMMKQRGVSDEEIFRMLDEQMNLSDEDIETLIEYFNLQ